MANAKCFKAEYEEYFSALKYFACRYITDEAVVCDLLQDFFIKLWEKGEVFENELAFKTYLYRSIRNNCLLTFGILAVSQPAWLYMSPK